MNSPDRYLITAALPYANGLKHIGHLAGAYLPADIYSRYLKAKKKDALFVCGSDEHGAAITIQAMKEHTTPKAIVDKYHEIIKQNFKDLGIHFDIYHRTSSPIHHETAQEFFTYLNNNGNLEQKETEQFYDEDAKTFLADRYIVGTCPVCGYDNAYGDQCERCGSTLSPEMLINPRSTLSGNPPIKKATTHWYLPLNKHEEFLRSWILEEHKDDWKTNVLGQCKSWIDAGLQPRAVTRDLDWGVKVPSPPDPPRGEAEKSSTSQNPPLEKRETYETANPILYGLLKTFVKEHRSNPTPAEIVMWELVRGKNLDGYKFRRQHIIGDYIADFVCLSEKIIIELDGYHHQLPDNLASDAERTEWLNEKGFEVIRFNNNEILNNNNDTLNKIIAFINSNKSKPGRITLPPSGGGGAKVLYVWFDAPIGYISATKQWAIDNNKDWQPYWKDEKTKLVHFIGKDNIVFHSIIFPVMLKLHGYILPDNVPANEFMNLEGDKMSTSRGWSIEMDEYINDWIKGENGSETMADVLRYYLTSISPETKDSEFTWKGFQEANNSELANIFGNFVNRAFVLMHKLCKGKVPPLHNDILDDTDKAMFADIENSTTKVESLVENYKFRDALFEVIDLCRKGNRYMQEKQPWIVAKQTGEDGHPTPEAQKSIDNCLHICLQLTANLAILINPFLPFTAKKLCYMMKVVDKMLDWENAGKLKLLSVGYSLREPQILFRKIEDSEIMAQVEKLKSLPNPSEGGANEQSPNTNSKKMNNTDNIIDSTNNNTENPPSGGRGASFEDFSKIKLKVGTIISAEKVQKADKLLKLEVDLGFEKRTIVSGIALHFQPEDIVGKQVTVVTNLTPRKMRGIESNGMILMAEDKSGKLHFINPEDKVDEGSGVS